jgi:hypothetical protein
MPQKKENARGPAVLVAERLDHLALRARAEPAVLSLRSPVTSCASLRLDGGVTPETRQQHDQ